MKKERLFELIEHTDEQLIAQAEKRKARRPALLGWGIIAACLALLLCGCACKTCDGAKEIICASCDG
ncbi:MAG: hypothetical protein IKW24_00705, partial [Clostridia bacterium]|nr:hypothetical protein [Clostridia bacterium]